LVYTLIISFAVPTQYHSDSHIYIYIYVQLHPYAIAQLQSLLFAVIGRLYQLHSLCNCHLCNVPVACHRAVCRYCPVLCTSHDVSV